MTNPWVDLKLVLRQYEGMQELEKLLKEGGELNPQQVREAVAFLIDPDPEPERKAFFLRALNEKGETPAEIAAFVNEFLQYAVDPGLKADELPGPMLDVVGTGGDGLNLFNVSTTSMFILAAGGVCVVKHGNRGITGKCGGADVLEGLGVKINTSPERLVESVKQLGLGFLFAPHYHPAFQAVGPARKLLAQEGRRSIFNLLGPLLNPARPTHQLVGVFDPKLVSPFADILVKLGREGAWVVHGKTEDGRGMDELSTLGVNSIAKVKSGDVSLHVMDPRDHGFAPSTLEEIVGGDIVENVNYLEGILAGSIKGARREIAALNAAAGFVITGLASTLEEGKAQAEEILDRGAAHAKLVGLQRFC